VPDGSDHSDEPTPGGVLASRVLAELAQIDEALGRIARGSYGTCVACGGPLGLQRIRAIPEARYCLGCSGQRPSDD
jgi:RNA polymerase-binding transcription factor DksA